MAKRTPVIRCRKCGSSTAKGDEFDVVIPYKAASSNGIDGFDEQGRMRLGYGDTGNPSWFGRPEIVCSCGHQWPTKLDWVP